MKKGLILSLFLAFCMTFVASCSSEKSAMPRYVKVDGDPLVDYFIFVNDSVIHYIALGGIHAESHYKRNGKEITVNVAPLVESRLKEIDDNTIEGSAPFFEGTWKLSE